MTKTKLKPANLTSGVLKAVHYREKTISKKSTASAERDTYEWICDGFFLRHRAGVAQTDVIELRNFQ